MNKSEALGWIADLFEEPPENVAESTPRSEILGWDSLGVLSLMVGLDEKFDIQLTETELNEMAKVGDILDLLARHDALEG
jgi:acyl carrier protein